MTDVFGIMSGYKGIQNAFISVSNLFLFQNENIKIEIHYVKRYLLNFKTMIALFLKRYTKYSIYVNVRIIIQIVLFRYI